MANNKDFENITVFIIEDKISDSNKARINEISIKYGRKIEYITLPNPQEFFNCWAVIA